MEIMCRVNKPLWVTGNMVIMEISFFVLKWFTGIYDIILYDVAVLKNSRYFTAVIYRDQTNAHFEEKIGENDCHSGNWKGGDFYVFFIKEENFNMVIMSTYSWLMVRDDQKEVC